jgi:hypothetical protein
METIDISRSRCMHARSADIQKTGYRSREGLARSARATWLHYILDKSACGAPIVLDRTIAIATLP